MWNVKRTTRLKLVKPRSSKDTTDVIYLSKHLTTGDPERGEEVELRLHMDLVSNSFTLAPKLRSGLVFLTFGASSCDIDAVVFEGGFLIRSRLPQ